MTDPNPGEFEAAVATFDGSHGVIDHRAPCEFGEAGLCGDESSRVDVAGRRSLERDVEPAFDRHTCFAPHPVRVDEVCVAPPVLGSVDPVGGVGIRHEHPRGVWNPIPERASMSA